MSVNQDNNTKSSPHKIPSCGFTRLFRKYLHDDAKNAVFGYSVIQIKHHSILCVLCKALENIQHSHAAAEHRSILNKWLASQQHSESWLGHREKEGKKWWILRVNAKLAFSCTTQHSRGSSDVQKKIQFNKLKNSPRVHTNQESRCQTHFFPCAVGCLRGYFCFNLLLFSLLCFDQVAWRASFKGFETVETSGETRKKYDWKIKKIKVFWRRREKA